jgi:NADH dehydrogenase FAD-containing subunit
MVIKTLFPSFYIALTRDWSQDWDQKNREKKNIYLLGQGWFSKGFMDHIYQDKFNIINIFSDTFRNTPLLIPSLNTKSVIIPFSYNNKNVNVNEVVKSIDIKESIINTNMQNIKYGENDYVVCGIGDNTPINSWYKQIRDINTVHKKGNGGKIAIVGAGNTGTELAFKLHDMSHYPTLYEGLKDSHMYLPTKLKNYVLNELMKKKIPLNTDTMYNKDNDKLYDNVTFAIGSRSNDLVRNWCQSKSLNCIHDDIEYNNIFFGGNCVRQTKVLNDKGIEKIMGPNAQVAYDQGKHVAQTINKGNKSEYITRNFVHSLYVGNNTFALYMNNYNAYLLVPQCLVNTYYKYKYGK